MSTKRRLHYWSSIKTYTKKEIRAGGGSGGGCGSMSTAICRTIRIEMYLHWKKTRHIFSQGEKRVRNDTNILPVRKLKKVGQYI